MKTKEQIKEKFIQEEKEDKIGLWWEFKGKLYFPYLPLEFLKTQVKEGVSDEVIKEEIMSELTRENIIKEIKDYLPFAWGKARDGRGISASRSIDHFKVYFWILDAYDKIDWADYEMYGKPILEQIEKYLGE